MAQLTNKEQMIHDYLQELLKKEFPGVDTADTSAFMEMFGIPHVHLLLPLLNKLDNMMKRMSLESAAEMSEEELDELAANRFHRFRFPGRRASGPVTLIFTDLPTDGTITITAGTVQATDRNGDKYKNTESVAIGKEMLGTYYDVDTYRFRVPVSFESENVGSKYNIEPGSIENVQASLPFLESAINEIPFSGGKDKESNVDFALRIQEGAYGTTPGVQRGYIKLAKEDERVEDVLVVGFGHPLMKRDIIGVAPAWRFEQTVREVHWGTKIDLYIRGTHKQAHTETLPVRDTPFGKRGVLLTKLPVNRVHSVRMLSTEVDIDPATLIVPSFMLMKEEEDETEGTLYEKAWVLLDDPRAPSMDVVEVTYDYNRLIEDLNERLYGDEEHRPPCADVLLKEMRQRFVYASFVCRSNINLISQEPERLFIKQRLQEHFKRLKTGQELQLSDATHDIVTDEPSLSFIDYMEMPPKLLVLDNDSRYIYYALNQRTRDILEQMRTENTFIKNIMDTYCDKVSVYDFFDMLHFLSRSEGWTEFFDDNQCRKKALFDMIREAEWGRRAYARSNTSAALAPTHYTISENHYFELSEVCVYNAHPYSKDEWENLLNMLNRVAQKSNPSYGLLQFSVYCILLSLVAAQPQRFENNLASLFALLQEAYKDTTIQDKFRR